MKILYLVHQFFPEFQSGTEKFVLNTALNSQNYGYEVKVITYSFLDDETFSHDHGEILSKEYLYKGIPVIAYKYKNSADHILNILECEKLRIFARNALKIENPDIVHVGHIIRVHEFIWAAINLSIPYVVSLTDFFLICPKVNLITSDGNLCNGPNRGDKCKKSCSELNNNYIRYRLDKAREILEKAKYLFSPSRFVREIFHNEFTQLNIKVNPHGISRQKLPKQNKTKNSEDKLIFAYMSVLSELKGIRLLLEAFKRIEKKNLILEVYGSGDENYLKSLKRLAKEDDRINFRGKYNSEQLANIYQKIDLLIIPSLCYETFSMVLHESLAFNVPALVSGIGALAEKIQNGKNGLTFLPGDALDLQRKMEFIAKRPEILLKMKDFIKNHESVPLVEEEFANYLRFYNKIIEHEAITPQ
jgi:glycosyltransferase involved in cell wall biosynthesis